MKAEGQGRRSFMRALRFAGKVFCIPLIAVTGLLFGIGRVLSNFASRLAGVFLLFLGGCVLYSFTTSNWSGMQILILTIGAVFGICVIIEVCADLFGIAAGRMIRFLHS